MSDYPAAFTELVGADGKSTVLKIFKASVSEDVKGTGVPGTVMSDGKTWMGICTADGVVLIEDLQLAGKKRMGIGDFLRGFHNPGNYSTSKGTSRETIATVHKSETTE